MGVHVYESGLYRDSSQGPAVCWALVDAQGRTFEHTPERTTLARPHPLVDESGIELTLRGSGREAGKALLVVLRSCGSATTAWVLSRHPLLARTPKHALTELVFQTPAGQGWEKVVAPAAALRAFDIWRSKVFATSEPAFLPLPTLCSATAAAHPYEYPSKRMLAEWLKAKCLLIPKDPSFGSTYLHAAGLRQN